MNLEDEKLIEIEEQLACPDGEKGKEMGVMMHATNIGMTIASMKALSLEDDDEVLELGHGNAMHLKQFFELANRLKYKGLDISNLMYEEAKKNASVINGEATFTRYDGRNIPFKENAFDKVFTVNTIYFWEEPKHLLKEIYRVLKPDGVVAITYAQKNFMKRLPFVKEKFTLYDNMDFTKLVSETTFSKVEIIDRQEVVKSKTGEEVIRDFSVGILKK